MTKLETMNHNELLDTPFEPLGYSIDKILPHGIFILAGSPKIGKSWLVLDICLSISSGNSFWNFPTEQRDVLYIALEDGYRRLQDRIMQLSDGHHDNTRLHLATKSLGISENGLAQQIDSFMLDHPNTTLIVIDTLKNIRDTVQDKNLYSSDYEDMKMLRKITDKHKVTLLLVHHTRKMLDPDPLNTISGSTGLAGAVDGLWILEKTKRTGDKGKLTISNRDTKGYTFDIQLNDETLHWDFIGNSIDEDDKETQFCILLDNFLQDDWTGTAKELQSALQKQDPNFKTSYQQIGRMLQECERQLHKNHHITVENVRTNKSRTITLKREPQEEKKKEVTRDPEQELNQRPSSQIKAVAVATN